MFPWRSWMRCGTEERMRRALRCVCIAHCSLGVAELGWVAGGSPLRRRGDLEVASSPARPLSGRRSGIGKSRDFIPHLARPAESMRCGAMRARCIREAPLPRLHPLPPPHRSRLAGVSRCRRALVGFVGEQMGRVSCKRGRSRDDCSRRSRKLNCGTTETHLQPAALGVSWSLEGPSTEAPTASGF
jgi:hypothetical protein